MNEKLKNVIKNPYWQNFRDVRFLGFVVFGILVLLASWSGVRVIETNYVLQQEIARLNQQNVVKELENRNLQLENEYYKTDTYLELQARKAFGKGAPGETLILVPKEVAFKYAPELIKDSPNQVKKSQSDKPTYQQNFEAWMKFIFHQQS